MTGDSFFQAIPDDVRIPDGCDDCAAGLAGDVRAGDSAGCDSSGTKPSARTGLMSSTGSPEPVASYSSVAPLRVTLSMGPPRWLGDLMSLNPYA